jgi:drug/metabolite transporter (DMT)-like permease
MSIQWGRILLAAFLMELILFAIAVPLNLIGATRTELYSLPPAAFIATCAVTVWLGRRIQARLVLHGVLIGVAGILMYVGLSLGAREPWQYVLGNALKVVGGAVGGMVLARQRKTQTDQALKAVYSKEVTTE